MRVVNVIVQYVARMTMSTAISDKHIDDVNVCCWSSHTAAAALRQVKLHGAEIVNWSIDWICRGSMIGRDGTTMKGRSRRGPLGPTRHVA